MDKALKEIRTIRENLSEEYRKDPVKFEIEKDKIVSNFLKNHKGKVKFFN